MGAHNCRVGGTALNQGIGEGSVVNAGRGNCAPLSPAPFPTRGRGGQTGSSGAPFSYTKA